MVDGAGRGRAAPQPARADDGGGHRDAPALCRVVATLVTRVPEAPGSPARERVNLVSVCSHSRPDFRTTFPESVEEAGQRLIKPRHFGGPAGLGEAQMLQGELRRWPGHACWAGTPVGLAVAAERLGGFGTSWASEHGARLDPGSVLGPWGKAELEPDPPSRVHICPGLPTALNVGDRGPRPVPGRLAGGRGQFSVGRGCQPGPQVVMQITASAARRRRQLGLRGGED